MSEAELHVLKARLTGGILNKAQRGELKVPLPVGLVYDDEDRVELDPDQGVQQSLRTFFATFGRVGSAWLTVRAFREQGLKFPRRGQAGSGEITWQELSHHVALATLHNPRYAGAFCFGRQRSWTDIEGKEHCQKLPREKWRFLKKDAHPGYITWEQFLGHQQRLLENQQSHGGGEPAGGPAREGPALLQGLVICGRCGRPMTVRYHRRDGRLLPDYNCQKTCVEQAQPPCQRIPGAGIDEAVGELLVQSVTPLALEAALHVQEEIQSRLAETSRLRRQQVQRVEYEAEQARVRYMRVDPNNRLVADTLEARWNDKLRALAQVREECEKQERLDTAELTDEQKARVRALAAEFPQLWRDAQTADRDRKRMARLLLEDVTLRRDGDILVQVRFKGGATHEMHLPLPKTAWALRMTDPQIVAEIDRLLEEHTEAQIVSRLNKHGWHTGCGGRFSLRIVNQLRRNYRLKNRRERLRERGWLTPGETAAWLDCPVGQVNYWRTIGLLTSICFDEREDYLYQKPSDDVVVQIRARQRRHDWKARHPQPHQSGAV